MDIENNFTFPVEPDFLLKDHFIYNGINAELYAYENCIVFVTQFQTKHLHFHEEFHFEICFKEEKCLGIKFHNPEEYAFMKQNWLHSDMWETFLIKKIKQRNFHEYFKPMKKLGKGNFASVYLAHNKKKDTLVAVKAFVKQAAFKTNGRKALQNEIAILRKISNPHLMRLLGVYETDNSLYIVTEYIEGMTLQSYLKLNQGRINYEHRKSIMKMLLKGLCQLQKHKILHRDLKPDNIMITKDGKNLKIVDFGLATETNIEKYIFVRCGTPGYVAPQILRIRDDQKPVLNSISDMFSLGSIFYQMLFERRLFNAIQHEDVLNQNRACVIKFTQEMKNSISFDEADLLQKMLSINPKNRISASQALEHSYICQKIVNIFGSVRNRLTKPISMKASRKNITSLDKNENVQNFKSLHK